MATWLSSRSGVRPTDTRGSHQLPTASGGRLRISPAVSVEFLYRDLDLKIPPRVDCMVMFAGPHLEQILTAYSEAVRLFSETRDPTELLAVEIIPALRRMLVAAVLSSQGEGIAEIAQALGMFARSSMVAAATSAGRRYGVQRLMRTYRAAIELDAGLKNGQVRGRDAALSELIATLVVSDSNVRPA